MEGKRFTMGLAAGLVVALAIVAASGQLGVLGTSPTPASGSETQVTTTQTAYPSTATSSASNVPQGNTSFNASTTTTESASTTHSTTVPSMFAALNFIQSDLPSSNVKAAASQSPLSNALLLVPVFVALLLGAGLYRAYSKARVRDKEG